MFLASLSSPTLVLRVKGKGSQGGGGLTESARKASRKSLSRGREELWGNFALGTRQL